MSNKSENSKQERELLKERKILLQYLIGHGMPVDLAPRALDPFEYLLVNGGIEEANKAPLVARYFFMQGFVAGAMSSVHHN